MPISAWRCWPYQTAVRLSAKAQRRQHQGQAKRDARFWHVARDIDCGPMVSPNRSSMKRQKSGSVQLDGPPLGIRPNQEPMHQHRLLTLAEDLSPVAVRTIHQTDQPLGIEPDLCWLNALSTCQRCRYSASGAERAGMGFWAGVRRRCVG
jgi:hypothetical protein